MIKNDERVRAVLEAGGTIVVPSRQRAQAVALAYSVARIARGERTFPAPDVLPLATWLGRCAETDRARRLPGLRRLGADEEWLAWREAARAAAEGSEWLQAAGLGDALRASLRLRRDWGLRWKPLADAEEGFQARALEAFAANLRARYALSSDDWPTLLAGLPKAERPLLFAGFDEAGVALRAATEALGGEWLGAPEGEGAAPADEARPVEPVETLLRPTDRAAELQAAALWCRGQLERNPRARLLVIVPTLHQCRSLATRTFARVLEAGRLLAGGEPDALFALEGGVPLPGYPLARAAFTLLALAGGELDFASLSSLLRSPYVALGAAGEAARLEAELRERNVTRATLPQLAGVATRAAPGVARTLEALAQAVQQAPARASPEHWAPRFAEWLALAGWPGAQPLGSAEQQARARCDELLGEFAQLAATGERFAAGEAAELLSALAGRVAFEPASGDVPVTLTASLGDPLVHYDGLWAMGLTAEAWPRAPQPDPFLPVAVQRAAGIRRATADGQRELAAAALQAWRARSARRVFSCPLAEDDAEVQPSSLLPGLDQAAAQGAEPGAGQGCAQEAAPGAAPRPADGLWRALAAGAVLEPLADDPPGPWPEGRPIPGGTRALVLQSECPFQAFATLRLGAVRMGDPQPGLPASERGSLLHGVLERTWRALGNRDGLLACSGAERTQLIDASVREGLARLRSRLVPPPAPLLLEVEGARVAALVQGLLEAEERRAPFAVEECERRVEATLGGVRLDVRIDRIDRLEDKRFVVLDYKSGRAEGFDPLDERPSQAQLLAYALLVPGEPAALATVHLRGGEVTWSGAAADEGVLPRLKLRRGHAASDFQQWLAHWRRVVPALARQFADGVATVDPRPMACERCHLAALCRIDADVLADNDAIEAGRG